MKVAALNALQQMDAERARPILRRVLARRDTGSVCLRRKALFLVAQQDAAGTEDILLESVRNDPDAEVQRQAVFWLSEVDDERVYRHPRTFPLDTETGQTTGDSSPRLYVGSSMRDTLARRAGTCQLVTYSVRS